ncbi:hypothetical protein J2046_003022 [Rhizobium petrolearium]|uniref:hypothetical protein n=1 Tax=Neorhizobium petrolearium TaxID=515361 RepID=UPI001AE8102E|nr:hypothetical protein [Neorhizobium petrolearium]MBP1844755.1 hypothetical protein [Neorhizobium petrolearium]
MAASPYRISIGVNIDSSGAKSGSADARQAVAAIGAEAEKGVPKIDNVATSVEKTVNAGGSNKAVTGIAAIGSEAERTRTKIQQLINASLGIHDGPANENARRWTGVLADEALSVDRLRAKYNPLFATIQQYKQAQIEIRTAHAMGALSTEEFSAAMTRERQAALASIDAIKGRSRALLETPAANSNNQRFQSANLAFQLQDTITTAPFMPWYTVALQQGPQVAAVLDSLENKSAGLAAAFMSLVSPWSLLSIAAVGATAFAVQYFADLSSSTEKAKSVLEGHAELIRRIKGAYGEAAEGLQEYARESNQIVRQDTLDRIKAYRETILSVGKDAREDLASLDPRDFGGATYTIDQMRGALALLDQGLKSGKPDLQAFVERLIQIENQSGTPENIREIIKELRNSAASGIEAQQALTPLVGAIDGIGNAAARQAGQVKALSDALNTLNGIAAPALSDREIIERTFNNALNDPRINTEAAIRQIEDARRNALARLEGQTIINSDGDLTNVPIPGNKPSILGETPDKSIRAASNAYRDLLKSADDRIGQMKLEAQLAGQTGVAADALRFKLDLLQQSEDKGRSLTPKQVEAINARVEAFKKYAEEAAKAQLASDLLFEREQLGRSAMDQQIAARLKGAGLPVDFDSYEAGLIRTNLQLQYARDLTGDFASTLTSSLQQGKDFWDALGDAGVSALKRISDTLVNDLLNSLFQVNSAAAGGSSSGGLLGLITGGISSLFGGSSGSASSSAWSLGLDDWQFARGGYTGPGGIHEPRGVVHAGEVVWSQRDVARAGGVATVEAMRLGRRGYADGGVVDVAPLMSSRMAERQSAAAADRGMGTLKLLLGLSADENGTIMPAIRKAIADNVPEYVQLAFDDYDQALPDRVAAIQSEPWRR